MHAAHDAHGGFHQDNLYNGRVETLCQGSIHNLPPLGALGNVPWVEVAILPPLGSLDWKRQCYHLDRGRRVLHDLCVGRKTRDENLACKTWEWPPIFRRGKLQVQRLHAAAFTQT